MAAVHDQRETLDLTKIPLATIEARIASLAEQTIRLHALANQLGDTPEAREYRAAADETEAKKHTLWHSMHRAKEAGAWSNVGCHTDQRGASGNSSIVQMESNKLLPWLMLTCLLSGLAIALSVFAIIRSSDSMRMSLLSREDVRVFDHALTAHGIDTDEHSLEKRGK
jgi:hypothetical protein